MIKVIDTYSKIDSLYENGSFCIEKWERYINEIYENSAPIFIDDMNDCLGAGAYSYEKDILPIINAVHGNVNLKELHTSFCAVTSDLNEKICNRFDHELDIDIVLYVGLCNAAGWVTTVNGRDVILLGIEKILELNWQDIDSMHGLIYHELGHVYHKQNGVFEQHIQSNSQHFIRQLFTEGVAMYFEQLLVNDLHYFHQDRNGWLAWCDNHFDQILTDFHTDLQSMNQSNQRYFGDWVSYCGKGDVGYYLGARFVQRLCEKHAFEHVINMSIDDVCKAYQIFANSI